MEYFFGNGMKTRDQTDNIPVFIIQKFMDGVTW